MIYPIYVFLDLVSITSPIGIFLGRISNFINGELVGKLTNSNWGILFPTYDDKLRHPSQLYEAFLEGLVLFIILNFIISKENYKIGTCSCAFLLFYGFFRIFAELFREPDQHLGYYLNLFSMGMLLSFLMILAGALLYYFLRKKNEI